MTKATVERVEKYYEDKVMTKAIDERLDERDRKWLAKARRRNDDRDL